MLNERNQNLAFAILVIYGLMAGFMLGKSLLEEENRVEIYLDCYGYQENCVPTFEQKFLENVDLNINWKR